jgi:hypothetical protein
MVQRLSKDVERVAAVASGIKCAYEAHRLKWIPIWAKAWQQDAWRPEAA